MSPSRKREAVDHLEGTFEVSERRACTVVDQPRSTQRYERKPASDEAALMSRLHELVRQHPRFGYRRIAVLLQREGVQPGFDRIYRLWRREGKSPNPAEKRRLGSSTNGWQYNEVHPHSYLGYVAAAEFARACVPSAAAPASPTVPPRQEHTLPLQP